MHIHRGSRSSVGGIPKPPPPRTPSSASAGSKGQSPSPEPYEIPLKMLEGDKRRPPPIPPGGMGVPPPVPRNKPLISGMPYSTKYTYKLYTHSLVSCTVHHTEVLYCKFATVQFTRMPLLPHFYRLQKPRGDHTRAPLKRQSQTTSP